MIVAAALTLIGAFNPPLVKLDPPFFAGGDISSLAQMESVGAVYRDGGVARPMLQIMRDHGCNIGRVRLWVNPSKLNQEVQDLAYVVQLGKRIKSAGFKFMLDFHYSDTWADPGKQFTPSAWAGLSPAQLEQQAHDYSRDCIATLKSAGAMPDFVQAGNEITNGMLWPSGKLSINGWNGLAPLLKAAINGIKSASGSTPPKIIIHIDRGGDWTSTKAFFEQLEARSVPYDVIGLSYYPTYHGPIAGLKTCLQNSAKKFHKPVMLVEVGYPYVASWFPNFQGEYPLTPNGQRDFLLAVVNAVKAVPGKRGIGVIWWEPGWYSVQTGGQWYGGWGQCMVDGSGNALRSWTALSGTSSRAGQN
jgi:arabinogalactan endo-1,4-beta-galactosidase